MKFKVENGKQFIILDENDKICITTKKAGTSMNIDVTCQNGELDIADNSGIINSIKGNGMLEKVYLPPVTSKEEIIKKCDDFLKLFEDIHDKFKKLITQKPEISMYLSFSKNFIQNGEIASRTIELDLTQNGFAFLNGVSISIPVSSDDIYRYLIASVLNYYLSQNYAHIQVKYENLNTRDLSATLNISSMINSYLSKTVYTLLTLHNADIPAGQYIEELKNKIQSQSLGENFDSEISYASRQLAFLNSTIKEEEKLERKI